MVDPPSVVGDFDHLLRHLNPCAHPVLLDLTGYSYTLTTRSAPIKSLASLFTERKLRCVGLSIFFFAELRCYELDLNPVQCQLVASGCQGTVPTSLSLSLSLRHSTLRHHFLVL